jgi:hypothetical protein
MRQMAAQPNMDDPSQNDTTSGIKIGSRKRKPVHDPLNSEVEQFAALLVKKKARLKNKHSKSVIA